MTMTVAAVSAEQSEKRVQDFFGYVHDFGNGGWYGGEYRQNGPNAPHLLRADYHYQDLYFSALSHMSHQVLEYAHADKYEKKNGETKSPCEWERLFPEIEDVISVHGPKVKAAFETLFDVCRDYQRDLKNSDAGFGGVTITREVHGISQERADELRDALHVIWKAYPAVDPRISEAYDCAMSAEAARKAFVSDKVRYSFTTGDDASDYRLADIIQSFDGTQVARLDGFGGTRKVTAEELSAIATQSIQNLEKMQEDAAAVSERLLSKMISIVYKEGTDKDDAVAKKIFSNLSSGVSTVAEEASKIRKGKYGLFAGGYVQWFFKDEKREQALSIADNAKEFLQFCMEVRSGAWFEQERNKIIQLAAQKALPGFGAQPNNNPRASFQPKNG